MAHKLIEIIKLKYIDAVRDGSIKLGSIIFEKFVPNKKIQYAVSAYYLYINLVKLIFADML